jgi:hypothetical protein
MPAGRYPGTECGASDQCIARKQNQCVGVPLATRDVEVLRAYARRWQSLRVTTFSVERDHAIPFLAGNQSAVRCLHEWMLSFEM